MRQTFTKIILVLALSLSFVGFFAIKTNALTIGNNVCYDGNTTPIPCTVTISSITVGNYTDDGPGEGLGYIAPGSNITISWFAFGATNQINHYEVYSGCGDTQYINTYNSYIGQTSVSTHSINWQVPNQKYCKIWVYAKDTTYTSTMMNAIGVSNTRFITTIPTITQICTPGTTNYCTTSENCGGTKTCNSSGSAWGSCIDTPNDNCPNIQVCAPGTTNYCITSENCGGTKTCNSFGSSWGSCIDNPNDNCPIIQTCTPGTTNYCTTSENCGGTKTCNSYGTGWNACIDNPNDGCPVVQICAPGTTNYCTTSENCGGTKTCNSYGTGWGTCVDTSNDNCPNTQVCVPGTTNYCTTSENCGGTKTCNSSGSAWGSCIDTPNDNCPNTIQVPVVTLNATTPITAGNATNLSWYTSNNPTICTASSTNSTWTGSKNISSGNESVTLYNAGNYTFTITCSNSAGQSSDNKTVVVNNTVQNVTVNLTASPTSISSGQSSTLNWYSNNANYCTASGAWSGSKNTSGSQVVYPTSANNNYSITCYGNTDQASDNENVYVGSINNQLPTVTLTANPTYITTGQNSTLTWYVSNANYCTASGDWGGNKSAYNGSETVYPIKGTNYYSIVCTNNYGSTSASANVNVTVLPPIYSTATFSKTGRDLSAGDRFYSDNISVNSGDVVEFYIEINVSNSNGATNIIVTDPLPYNLIYRSGTTKVNGVSVADGITGAGLYLGNLSQGTVKTITFQAVTRNANYGTIVINTAQLRADNISTIRDGANVNYNRGTVLGAETVDTGPSEVIFISLIVALACTGLVIYSYNKNAKFQSLFEGAKAKIVNSKIAHWQL